MSECREEEKARDRDGEPSDISWSEGKEQPAKENEEEQGKWRKMRSVW